MTAISPSCTERRRRERGQATIEFGLAMLLLIAGISALYQALHFERDVFNRLLALRQRAVHRFHQDQDNTPRQLMRESISFSPLAEVTPFPVPFQTVDLSIAFPSKTFTMQRGTQYRDPFSFIHSEAAVFLALHSAHYEGTKDLFQRPFDLGTVPVPVSFYVTPPYPYMPATAYGYTDPP